MCRLTKFLCIGVIPGNMYKLNYLSIRYSHFGVSLPISEFKPELITNGINL